MTPEKAIELLNEMRLEDDPEDAHRLAENILCDFLRKQGFSGVAKAFDAARDRVGFWYA